MHSTASFFNIVIKNVLQKVLHFLVILHFTIQSSKRSIVIFYGEETVIS